MPRASKPRLTKDEIREKVYAWVTQHQRLPHVRDFENTLSPHAVGCSYAMVRYHWERLADVWEECVQEGIATRTMLTTALAMRSRNYPRTPSTTRKEAHIAVLKKRETAHLIRLRKRSTATHGHQ